MSSTMMFRDRYPRLALTRYQARRRRLEQIAYTLHADPDRTRADIQTVREVVRFLRSEEQRLANGWLCRHCRRARVWRQN